MPTEPQPGPYSWEWATQPATMTVGDEVQVVRLTRLRIETTGGSAVVFIMPDDLEKFIQQAHEKLGEARTGIIRAAEVPPGIIQPNGGPHR